MRALNSNAYQEVLLRVERQKMGTEQSTLRDQKSKTDQQYSTSKPIIGSESDFKTSLPKPPTVQRRTAPVVASQNGGQGGTLKHNIIVVADGSVTVKDPDPELIRLNTIPTFRPIIKTSLNVVNTSFDLEMLEQIDHRSLLLLCLRYQDHLKQLAEAVAFDQKSLSIRIKEVDHLIHMISSRLAERQKKYRKCVGQFEIIHDIKTSLDKIKTAMDNISPSLEHLNQILPDSEQLPPFSLFPAKSSIQNS